MAACTPRKNTFKRKLLHEDSHEISGYVTFVSTVKNKASGTKSAYFEIYVSCESYEVRIVSFSLDDHPTLARNLNKGYSFLDLEKSGDDYKYSYCSSFLEKAPQHELRRFVQEPKSISDALEMELYSRVCLNVRILKTNNQGISLEGLRYKVFDVIDNSIDDPRQLTVYGNLTEQVQLNQNYQINHLTLSRFSGVKVFKSSERTSLSELLQNAIPPKENQTDIIVGVVKGVTMSSLNPKYQCSHCNEYVDIDGSVGYCKKCDQMQAVSSLINMTRVQFKVTDANNNSRSLVCDHDIVCHFIEMNLDNKIQAMKKFLNTALSATFEVQSGNVLTLHAHNDDDMSVFGD